MRKGVVLVFVMMSALAFASAVHAFLTGGGAGEYRVCSIDPVKAREFHEHAQPLRDRLIARKLELRKEFIKSDPDGDKIAALRKEITDIRARIWKKADQSGVPEYKMRFRGCSWIQGQGIIKESLTPV